MSFFSKFIPEYYRIHAISNPIGKYYYLFNDKIADNYDIKNSIADL